MSSVGATASYDAARGAFTCGCGECYHVPADRVGKRVRCPFCYALAEVPLPAPLTNSSKGTDRASMVPFLAGSWGSPRAAAWLRWAALFLLIPLGGPIAVWLTSRASSATASEGSPGELDATGYGSMATDDEMGEARRKGNGKSGPAPIPTPIPPVPAPAPDDRVVSSAFGLEDDCTYIDPDVDDRLMAIYHILCAYNRVNPDGFLPRRGTVVPEGDRLKVWFLALSRREQVAIDVLFNDRESHRAMIRSEIEARRADRAAGRMGGPQGGIIGGRAFGGHDVKLFENPGDAFVSPRDGLPFLIESRLMRFPPRTAAANSPVVAREALGVEVWDGRFLEKRHDVRCIHLGKSPGRMFVATGDEPPVAANLGPVRPTPDRPAMVRTTPPPMAPDRGRDQGKEFRALFPEGRHRRPAPRP